MLSAKFYNFILFHNVFNLDEFFNFLLLLLLLLLLFWFLNFNFDNNLKITKVCKNWFWACYKLRTYFKSYYKNFKF